MNGGGGVLLYVPRVDMVSAKLMPTASTRTITSPGLGTGFRHVADFQNFRTTGTRDDDSFHGTIDSRRRV